MGVMMAVTLEQPPLSEAEARRRLPSLHLIDDADTRGEAARLSRFAPAYFWERPGSTAGYHNDHEHGLWAHTLRLSTVIERLADSYTQRGLLTDSEVDLAHAAAILHDQRKEGPDGGQTAKDHDLQMASVITAKSELGDGAVRAVERHMGPWYEGPEPGWEPLAELVHTADMVASSPHIEVAVPEPVPEELEPYTTGADL